MKKILTQETILAEKYLLESLRAVKLPIEQDADGLRIGEGPSRVQVQQVHVWQHETGKVWLSHLEIVFALNPARAETLLIDCATGWGDTAEIAIAAAVEAICKTSVPPIFSLLYSQPVLDAEFFPPDDPLGFLGWEAFSSPYVCKGQPEATSQLIQYVQQAPLLAQVAHLLEAALDKPMLNTVRLYVGFDGHNYHAECRINNELNEVGKAALLKLELPQLEQFASISQFLLLLRKVSS